MSQTRKKLGKTHTIVQKSL